MYSSTVHTGGEYAVLLKCVHDDSMKEIGCLKKNQNAPRPSEDPPVRGEKCQNVYVGAML